MKLVLSNDIQSSLGKLYYPYSISSIKKRMTEKAMQEMDELNIKCLQVLRSIVHNEERKMPEDWATRTTEPAIKKLVPDKKKNNTKSKILSVKNVKEAL